MSNCEWRVDPIFDYRLFQMEARELFDGRSRDELLFMLQVLVDVLGGFGKDKPRPLNPRTVRSQNRWLLERPTTDESRAWLLHELTRRIYESQGKD